MCPPNVALSVDKNLLYDLMDGRMILGPSDNTLLDL